MKPFVLRTDASGVGVVAVHQQEVEPNQAKYHIIEKEYLAAVWGIRCLKLYLAGKRIILETDHKPLKYLNDAAYQNDREFCWAMSVQEYSFHVEDVPG